VRALSGPSVAAIATAVTAAVAATPVAAVAVAPTAVAISPATAKESTAAEAVTTEDGPQGQAPQTAESDLAAGSAPRTAEYPTQAPQAAHAERPGRRRIGSSAVGAARARHCLVRAGKWRWGGVAAGAAESALPQLPQNRWSQSSGPAARAGDRRRRDVYRAPQCKLPSRALRPFLSRPWNRYSN
jgi:hypothetical protein